MKTIKGPPASEDRVHPVLDDGRGDPGQDRDHDVRCEPEEQGRVDGPLHHLGDRFPVQDQVAERDAEAPPEERIEVTGRVAFGATARVGRASYRRRSTSTKELT